MPAVSVVIPAYNVQRFIRQALDSVLAQSYQDFEVLVIDDGSTDGTAEIAAEYGEPVRVLRQENAGPSAARNHGVREARGDFVAFLDADDLWRPEKLAEQMPLFDDAGRVGLVYCRFQRMDAEGQPLPTEPWPTPTGEVYYRMLERSYVPASTPVVRASCFERAGTFPEDMSWAEDWHLWIRIARHYQFACADQVLVEHRETEGGLWSQTERAHQGVLEVLARTARETDDRRTKAICRRMTRRARRNHAMDLLRGGQWRAGRAALLRALARWPWDPVALAALGLSVAPAFLRRRLVASWRARPRLGHGSAEGQGGGP
jgi:glycosyltransferase involved in cell wall biosynthesis